MIFSWYEPNLIPLDLVVGLNYSLQGIWNKFLMNKNI